MTASFALIAFSCYLLGSIPSGYLISRLGGVDIRTVGSGNIGATNVTRALGKRYGYPVFLSDFAKGMAGVLMSKWVAQRIGMTGQSVVAGQIAGAVFCVIGNAFPIWLRFRGGKGVATSAGIVFALMPLAAAIVTLIWIAIFWITRYVSLASILAAIALPITMLVTICLQNGPRDLLLFYVSLVLAAIVILRHRANVSRLLSGTEQSFRRSED